MVTPITFMWNIIQICNGFSSNSFYRDFFVELHHLGLKQTIIAPIRSKTQFKQNNIELRNFRVLYPFIVRSIWDRVFFRRKLRKTIQYVTNNVDLSSLNFCHAHTLFSDGGVAYELNKKYGVPYIVAVRNVDVNYFLRYAFFLRKYGLEILEHALKVVFISNVYPSYLKNYYPNWFKNNRSKIAFISNGVNDFWIKNLNKKKMLGSQGFKLIYFGDFNSNKNIESIIFSVKRLRSLGIDISLKAIGLGRNNEQKHYVSFLQSLAKEDNFCLVSAMTKEHLLKELQVADAFIMVSHMETFGLAYVEALSQGLPIIYTRGQGIDETFPDGFVGKATSSNDIDEICEAILYVKRSYDILVENISQISFEQKFSWSGIAKSYYDIYAGFF
ncbi:MAG TPA: glycosyltransferase [Candidatus Rifleibacterium sp.]|nr:glycosyltransferase [Candidatus Rifleibacterium sp.]